MKFSKLFKYIARFTFLQATITAFTIFYFDRFLMNQYEFGYLIIINNLLEDRDRFYPFIQNDFIKIDIYLAIFVFVFLIVLYSTKFYTYVNELTFSIDNKFFGEYLNIYLLWTSFLMAFLFLFRFNVVSRFYLFIFTFLVPVILQIFRNTEVLSSLLGRSVTNESFITFNLSDDSIFRSLRIMTFRKDLGNYTFDIENEFNDIVEKIDTLNKKNKLNLIIINLENQDSLPINFENYLLNTNKKILLISTKQLVFNSVFIKSESEEKNSYLTYFNNDIQYGSKYILKRALDITFSLILFLILLPLILMIGILIFIKDRTPIIISQNRVGLHGEVFKMYKFRTMYVDSHEKREELSDLNKNDKVIFKIENDPRIFSGGQFLRKYSLDELPQLFNILKGQMSLVGPRPLFEEDTEYFDKNYMRRLNVLPGLTGLLQINERNASEFDVWYKYDIEYINNWSLGLDLKILLKTPFSLINNKSKGL